MDKTKTIIAQLAKQTKTGTRFDIDEQAGSYTTNVNFATENERDLLCKVIQVAADDYIGGCEEAAEFFFAEDSDIQEYFFDHLDIDFGYFIKLLKKKRLTNNGCM